MESANPPKVAKGLAAPSVKLDEAGLIAEDLPCRHCGYNLRTLSTKVQCPECGTSVGRSVHGDYLRYADPAWVRGLATGASLVFAAITLQTLHSVILGGLVLASLFVPKWFFMIGFGVSLIAGIGFWLMTTADPGRRDAPERRDPKKVARILLAIWILLVIPHPFQGGLLPSLRYAVWFLTRADSIAFAIVMLSCVQSLISRIPDQLFARSCRRFTWLMIITIAGSAIVHSVRIFGAASTLQMNAGPIMAGSVGILYIAATIWAIRISFRLQAAFRNAAQLSQATSDAHSSPQLNPQGGIP